jgi:polysaccharide deacetylase 2 family uncharacterized protein YibQ
MSGWFRKRKKEKPLNEWERMEKMSQQFKEEEIILKVQADRVRKKKAKLETLGIIIDESEIRNDVIDRINFKENPRLTEMENMMNKMGSKFKEEKEINDRLEKVYDEALAEFE